MTTAAPLEFPLLVVDDEPNIVNAIRRELATPPLGRYRYAVEGFTDPAAALARAREQAFAVVISDYRMPNMTGLEFLKALAELQPDCSRILISGAIELQELVSVLNRAHIFAFLEKPWSDYDLKANVLLGITRSRMLKENRRLAALVDA